ncbi:ThiF family adenylyltransferase [Polaribacter sp. 20A6]|uniref:ThiF family adenylyltransferase n=1 Tax=Polaribacter sp. 20A6 TaxID=2687289 RepID=UPI0013FD85B5|nr:ThiF family adenylyltransferase [Polaribacter sp. 20A6]
MHSKLINPSLDIIQLRNNGYEVEIKENHLLIHNIPYFNTAKIVCKGILVSKIGFLNNQIIQIRDHRVFFIGDKPCDANGADLNSIINNSNSARLGQTIAINHMFSSKPKDGYKDYYHKMESYINMLTSHVQSIYPKETAKTFRVLKDVESNTPFTYVDTNSTRSEIQFINDKLSNLKIGIIGLGGTGSYILDLIAKTSVSEIHLFDGDEFCQHNAFRSPGATSINVLDQNLKKVDYQKGNYSNIHQGIISHSLYIEESNLILLKDLDFIFISIDKGHIKKLIFNYLEERKISFIDCGIGVINKDNSLLSSIRVNFSIDGVRDHIWNDRISFEDEGDDKNLYSSNIQLCELNSLNACFAVIKWKQHYGVYHDIGNGYSSIYNSSVNEIINDDVRG